MAPTVQSVSSALLAVVIFTPPRSRGMSCVFFAEGGYRTQRILAGEKNRDRNEKFRFFGNHVRRRETISQTFFGENAVGFRRLAFLPAGRVAVFLLLVSVVLSFRWRGKLRDLFSPFPPLPSFPAQFAFFLQSGSSLRPVSQKSERFGRPQTGPQMRVGRED